MKHLNILSTALNDFPGVDHSRALHRFNSYYQELLAWNQRINLISKKDENRIVIRHFLESLGFLKHIDFPFQARVLDLGSGAGLPGIPLAIVRPDLHITLVEAKKKKTEFLQEVSQKLTLDTIRIINKRMEEIAGKMDTIDIVVCRSVASLAQLYKWTRLCLEPSQGKLITIKGEQYKKELSTLIKHSKSDTRIEYTIASFNPFPELYSIRKCYLVVVIFKK
jgi:16S rRNA (guanine527-N7)-methyltransferase